MGVSGMAYSWCRFTIGRDVLERYAGALRIYANTVRESACEETDELKALALINDSASALGAAAALRTIIQLDGEVDHDTFVNMVMSLCGGGE